MSAKTSTIELGPFQFHLSERTVRMLLRDPKLPGNPSFTDRREALLRLDEVERTKAAQQSEE